MPPVTTPDLAAPVTAAGTPAAYGSRIEDGIAIALSGGGFRAMLFHTGTLWRLFELGILRDAARVSSVSGGSITAGVLALAWPRLDWSERASFVEHVVAPIRAFAGRTTDIPAVVVGLIAPGGAGGQVERAYRRHLFGDATLQDLPVTPRFVINATNLGNGRLWRFSRPYMGDWQTGRILDPVVPLARAVAASSGFPPFLSPLTLAIDPARLIDRAASGPAAGSVLLTDGGVYDNLGLEAVWKRYRTLIVSDGGAALGEQPRPSRTWPLLTYRALAIIQDQVHALRVRQLIAGFDPASPPDLHRTGVYIAIDAIIGTGDESDPPLLSRTMAAKLATTPTRLGSLDAAAQTGLINLGYAICDARIRRFYRPGLPAPATLPYPANI